MKQWKTYKIKLGKPSHTMVCATMEDVQELAGKTITPYTHSREGMGNPGQKKIVRFSSV